MSRDLPQTASSGHRVGSYELATELERGALGPLFAARVASGREEGRLVTVRRLSVEGCARKDVEGLIEATRTARRVRHSKLAAVLDVVDADREIAVVGEYFEGRSLSSLQRLAFDKHSAIPPAVALRIGLEVLHGLRAVRETWKAIAPRTAGAAPRGGLSPDNVFVAAFGDVLLSEIGVSSVARTLAPFRELPAVLAYRSPEQLSRDGADSPDERSDVFSVGVMLWELMANRPLFGGDERLRSVPGEPNPELAERIRRDLQSKLIPSLGSLERGGTPIARAAVEIVERALRRDPETRFSGIDQMLGSLLALNRDFLANADQVQAAIDPLVGAELAAQRVALGFVSGGNSSPASSRRPDSNRPTLRPQPSLPELAPAVPRPAQHDSFGPQEPAIGQFSKHEAPTYPSAQPATARAIAQSAHKPSASSASRSQLPRLPKPPGRQSRASSTPPPPPVRKPSTPPPPARAAPQLFVPAPSTPPAAAPSLAAHEPTATPPPAPRAPSSIPPAFGEPLPPLPELTETALPAITGDAPAAAAPAMPSTEVSASSWGSAAPGASATSPLPSARARRMALVIGGAVGLAVLIGLLSALLRPGAPADSATALSSAKAGAHVRAPAAVPAPEAVTEAPPETPAATSAPLPRPENPVQAPTKPVRNVDPAPPAPAPRELERRPEARPEPQRKPFRPKGI